MPDPKIIRHSASHEPPTVHEEASKPLLDGDSISLSNGESTDLALEAGASIRINGLLFTLHVAGLESNGDGSKLRVARFRVTG